METGTYIYSKEIDWSALTDGITLPQEAKDIFTRNEGSFLQRGQQRAIKMILNGKIYTDAIIKNENFSKKYERSHKSDIIQIRYRLNGPFVQELKAVFQSSYQFLAAARANKPTGDRSRIYLPEEKKEYLAIYATAEEDTYFFEPILAADMAQARTELTGKTEEQIETEFDTASADPNAGILISQRTVKIRKLNRSIGENLKKLYEFRCQICGETVGSPFGLHVCEAHHIDYFIRSLNNDASNQMIVCPNHHRIIHEGHAQFLRDRMLFRFTNGADMKIKLDKHLRIGN